MRFAAALAVTLAIAPAVCSPANHARNSPSWASSNLYFLHALPADEQSRYIDMLADWGVKALRLWVTGLDGGCIKGSTATKAIPHLEPDAVGTYDTTVLAALDDTLKLLHCARIKAIISPHDAGQINGANGCDVYCDKYGNQTNFYSSTEGKADYDARLSVILNYESPNFGGRKWSQLDEVIMAFDLQNEPMINAVELLEKNDPDDWLCGRAGVLKGLIDKDSEVHVATGGIGGSHYCCDHEFNDLQKALYCDAIDIISVHGYMSKATDWAYFITGDASILDAVEAAGTGKKVMLEEWGVAADSQDGFEKQVAVFNGAGVPWLYWQVVPGKDQTQEGAPASCGYDGFEIGLESSKGDVHAAVSAAKSATAAQDWTGYI
ncbi:putative beta- -mannanase protein [Botryosphaeria dothidea]|uniref:mannan endo-1,4-beta-mannosidase n=1 Tax=Botryosphaeria dothidea TaxID=55169 RepID=A0A8H4MY69_9PEZI|nr:putative beta- -mannanase protein [Botryosphaeria dothidea]